MPDLSIVIVSYNARDDLARTLASIVSTPPAVTYEIVVVDNASSDSSAEVARQTAGVRVIEAGSNLGFAAATNLGIRASSGRDLLLLNSDTIVPPGAIDRLVAALQAHPDVAVVGPRLVDGAGHAELSFGPMLSPLREWRRQRLMRALSRGDADATAQVEAATRQSQFPDWVSGACLLVRRTDALAVGLLDERFFIYTEDVDFCASIRARGRRVLFEPSIEVVHLRGRSVAAAPEATRAAYRRSHLAFYEKHYPWLAPFLRAYHVIRG
jgi:GT2 family glycosyltransferase